MQFSPIRIHRLPRFPGFRRERGREGERGVERGRGNGEREREKGGEGVRRSRREGYILMVIHFSLFSKKCDNCPHDDYQSNILSNR